MTADNNALNSDAIYAGLVYIRDYAASDKADAMQRHVDALGATSSILLVPRFNFGPELFEEIYPGERTSVEVGLELGRWVVYSGFGLLEEMAKDDKTDEPVQKAVLRFISDRAH